MATCRSDTWATMQSTLLIGLPALALSQVRDMADMTYSIGSVLMYKPHIHKLHSCLFQYVPWISSRSRVIHIMLSKTYLTFPHFHLIGCLIYTVIINQLPPLVDFQALRYGWWVGWWTFTQTTSWGTYGSLERSATRYQQVRYLLPESDIERDRFSTDQTPWPFWTACCNNFTSVLSQPAEHIVNNGCEMCLC